MKLYCHPISPYARKAMIMASIKGIAIEEVCPVADGAKGYANSPNPLGKIPALELDNGEQLYDSTVICQYLDSLKSPLLSVSGPARWEQLRLHALGDGLSDAVYNYRYETVRPDPLHWSDMIVRHETAICSVLDALEDQVELLGTPWTFGNIAIICALGYAGYRTAHLEWKHRAPRLARWHKKFESEDAYKASHGFDAK